MKQYSPVRLTKPLLRKPGSERVHGKPKKKAEALPLEDLECIVLHLASLNTLKAKRDNALLQVGYFGGFRRSEVVKLEVQHVVWEGEGIVITLPRSKSRKAVFPFSLCHYV